MKLIICVDDNNGVAFNHRRLSFDRKVFLEIQELVNKSGGDLWCTLYSKKLLSKNIDGQVLATDTCMYWAEPNDFVFLELIGDITPYLNRVNEIYLFGWNRVYPSDTKLDLSFLNANPSVCHWTRTAIKEFQGTSHDVITLTKIQKQNIEEAFQNAII